MLLFPHALLPEAVDEASAAGSDSAPPVSGTLASLRTAGTPEVPPRECSWSRAARRRQVGGDYRGGRGADRLGGAGVRLAFTVLAAVLVGLALLLLVRGDGRGARAARR